MEMTASRGPVPPIDDNHRHSGNTKRAVEIAYSEVQRCRPSMEVSSMRSPTAPPSGGQDADGMQTILCAELLSTLAQRLSREAVGSAIATEEAPSPIGIRKDPDVIEFCRRINTLAQTTKISPSLLLSSVLSESQRSNSVKEGPESARTTVHYDRDDILNRVLFEIVWRQYLFPYGPLQSVERSASDQRDESMDQKQRIRLEKLKRWKEKRKSRDFAPKIRYPARQSLANARKRFKGQFVSNKESTESST